VSGADRDPGSAPQHASVDRAFPSTSRRPFSQCIHLNRISFDLDKVGYIQSHGGLSFCLAGEICLLGSVQKLPNASIRPVSVGPIEVPSSVATGARACVQVAVSHREFCFAAGAVRAALASRIRCAAKASNSANPRKMRPKATKRATKERPKATKLVPVMLQEMPIESDTLPRRFPTALSSTDRAGGVEGA
jgi:hypothetical protein